MVRGEIRVGCSGWSYDDWRGVVYPADAPARTWFAHYAERFDTVELNTTFYRLPDAVDGRGVGRAGPARVLLRGQGRAVRLPPHEAARRRRPGCPTTSTGCDRLGPALGPNLVQLPPRWRRERTPAWTTSWPRRRRTSAGRSSCATRPGCTTRSSPPSPNTVPRSASTTCSPTTRGCSPPTGPTSASTGRGRWTSRTTVATAAGGCGGSPTGSAPGLDEGADVHAYFNNDWHGHAVADARVAAGPPQAGAAVGVSVLLDSSL